MRGNACSVSSFICTYVCCVCVSCVCVCPSLLGGEVMMMDGGQKGLGLRQLCVVRGSVTVLGVSP